jgi:hypothetical protein
MNSGMTKYRVFERLNQEKTTPHFMSLVKIDSNGSGNIDTICDNAGAAFESDTDRENYITGFYQQLYKKTKPNLLPVMLLHVFWAMLRITLRLLTQSLMTRKK